MRNLGSFTYNYISKCQSTLRSPSSIHAIQDQTGNLDQLIKSKKVYPDQFIKNRIKYLSLINLKNTRSSSSLDHFTMYRSNSSLDHFTKNKKDIKFPCKYQNS